MNQFSISSNLIDLFFNRLYPVKVTITDGIITDMVRIPEIQETFILPGFIDAHIHIESSMLVPTAFAQLAVTHGTVATVSDPHEIANVCGMDGVQYMIDNSKLTPFKIFFGAPSCVPATGFETSGATLNSKAIETLLQNPDIRYLTEMMNYPGVLHQDPEVMAKIKAAQTAKKPIDGHAPGLRGENAKRYAEAGISTDHECFTIEEALEKIKYGMHILIREGSAAKNFDTLIDLLKTHPEKVMFCSDDKHPDELELHHIKKLVKRALDKGYNVYDVLRAACVNPVLHYNLPVGLLRINDPADFIIIDNFDKFNILKVFINGVQLVENNKSLLPFLPVAPINNFNTNLKQVEAFAVKAPTSGLCSIRVIEAIEGKLITNEIITDAKIENGYIVSNVENDILKIAVINRYEKNQPIALGFIKNFGLKKGAIASTVGHDCHNLIVVGVDDESMVAATNTLIEHKGGIAVANSSAHVFSLPLEIAGLMSVKDGQTVAKEYARMNEHAKELGTTLQAPFMTLSFMALLVIPSLKLSDRGLFDGNKFQFVDLTI